MELIYHHFARFGLEMHIGRGSSESKTECVFFPPPQFFQRLERSNDAASMIQRAFRQAQHTRNAYSALEHAHRARKPPTSNALTLLPENFPIGSHVTVVSSHPKHANTIGVVTRHTAKFVALSPVDSPQDRIRILPQSLILVPPPAVVPPKPRNSRTTQRCVALLDTEDDQSQTQGRERDNDAYDKLPETAKFHVADGYVGFTRTFCYLGSLINYSLRDDDDITARIASATAAMGALKDIWRNPHLDIYNKYLLFRAIPMNLLLWGAETWSLRKTQLDQLEVFLHRSIRRILQISMSTVKEERIRNERVREMFYSIPCVRNMIASRQADFIGKMIRGPPDRPSRNMITACCDHKRRVGRPQTTGKIFMVENLRLLFQDVNTVYIDRFGSLRDWINEANDECYWKQLVKRLLHPGTPIPECPETWGPLPLWHA
jgi:hypothetical protein